jgi:aspartate carbamoyltransferase catalytic subunit
LSWTRRHLLSLEGLTREEINTVLDQAVDMLPVAAGKQEIRQDLNGYRLVSLFAEADPETELSFSLAARNLGAEILRFSAGPQEQSLSQAASNLKALGGQLFIVRHRSPLVPQMLARRLDLSVINAGDGYHENPSQALTDIFTMREVLGHLEGLAVGIIGDVKHSSVARSNFWGLKALGARVVLIGPPTLIPRELRACGAEISRDLDAVLPELDVINVLPLKSQRQSQNFLPSLREYSRRWGVNALRLQAAGSGLMIMHSGSITPGVEISPEVADSKKSLILKQVTNAVAVRMALLRLVHGASQGDANG